ncbi:ATP-binding cassette domain-containing protein [bacterium]|nr:ATP-binding cassette domain-containing protein [bacterium]
MALLSLRNLSFTWSGPPLLDHATIEIERGERIGLLGRNGAGKSTLMKIIVGEVKPDDGTVQLAADAKIARLIQEVPDDETRSRSVAEIVREGYVQEEATADEGHSHDNWKAEHAVERTLSRMKLDGDAVFSTLSSGMKRRALLAQALVMEPDILLLDEPTNHLDIDSILWLEGFLRKFDGTLIFVTHDRTFLQALATRIIEIDRGRLFDWTCNYETFLQRKQDLLDAEEKANAHFDRKLAEEEVWIRQGIKARRTRNEGRVRALKRMREERRQRREKIGNVRMQAVEAERSGQLVLEAKDVGFSYGGRPIISGLSLLLTRGDRVGIIGPNGAGKSTLLKLLLGELQPTSGTLRRGTNLEVIYFDQLREQIEEEKTVAENVGEGQDHLLINGQRKHIYGYLQDFLFTPERARRPARYLSGGERNRLLLARIFKRPSNLMVLDEPTNDLDAETLELLEELVVGYSGTLLLVSHDRAFLNNVVTSTLAVEGDGSVKEYDGGYDDYVRQKSQADAAELQAAEAAAVAQRSADSSAAPLDQQSLSTPAMSAAKKLSWKEERELETLPEKIEQLEQEQSDLHAAMADPSFFRQDSDTIATTTARLEALATELETALARWEELESRA